MKPSTYFFHMETKALADFQICISVPLRKDAQELQLCSFFSSNLVGWNSLIVFPKVLPSFSDSKSSINRKELLIFRTLIVRRLPCALTQSPSLWTRKGFAKSGAESDPIGIPITWIMIFPLEKKQLCKINVIAFSSNYLVKTKWCPLSLDDDDAQLCLLITMQYLVPPFTMKSTVSYKMSSSLSYLYLLF